MLGLKRGVVALYDHQPFWEENATQTIELLRSIVCDIAMDIQHVGSTAIRTIQAKPIIDIAVAVDSFDEVMLKKEDLEKNGFLHRPKNDSEFERFFVCGDFVADIGTHYIHMVKTNSSEWKNYIQFRDYLNIHPERAHEYEVLKQTLQKAYSHDRAIYTEKKATLIKEILREANGYFMLGKQVTVIVDRPLGSIHPEHEDIVYPINYGYVEGVAAQDGEEQDVYIVGVQEPLATFTGKIIAIALRKNDIEDKWVVARENETIYESEIKNTLHFVEQYFQTNYLCLYTETV